MSKVNFAKLVKLVTAAEKAAGNKYGKLVVRRHNAQSCIHGCEIELDFNNVSLESDCNQEWERASLSDFELAIIGGMSSDLDCHSIADPPAVELYSLIDSKELLAALDYCEVATDSTSSRYALGGCLFDRSSIVATDGRRRITEKE